MPKNKVIPVFDESVRDLCFKPYPGRPQGCPNYGKKRGCPPSAPLLEEIADPSWPCFVIWNVFNIGAQMARMLERHPGWSERQQSCCRYWQKGARKQLEMKIEEFKRGHPKHTVTRCPEAMGVNVTGTMLRIGVELEWPPKRIARQVAIAFVRKEESDD